MVGKDGMIENHRGVAIQSWCGNNNIDNRIDETKQVVLARVAGNQGLVLCRLTRFVGTPGLFG